MHKILSPEEILLSAQADLDTTLLFKATAIPGLLSKSIDFRTSNNVEFSGKSKFLPFTSNCIAEKFFLVRKMGLREIRKSLRQHYLHQVLGYNLSLYLKSTPFRLVQIYYSKIQSVNLGEIVLNKKTEIHIGLRFYVYN